MDFIERIFGFSPDGGSGAFELLLVAAPVAAVVWRVVAKLKQQRKI